MKRTKKPANKEAHDDSDEAIKLNTTGNKKSQFRSSLSATIDLLESIKMTTGTSEKLEATPFWFLLSAIISKEIQKKDVRTDNFSMSKILQSYSKEREGFVLGGKTLRISPNDFRAIFGIKGGSSLMKINKEQTPKRHHTKDRLLPYFPIGSRLSSADLKNAVLKLAAKSKLTNEEEEDLAILIVLHLLANFFLSFTKNECPWGWAPFVTEFTKINEWDWASGLCNYLNNFLDEGLKDTAQSCQGCVPIIVYAICEHTDIFKPINPTKFPRFLKWEYSYLSKQVAEAAYKGSQVNVHKLKLSEKELADLGLQSKHKKINKKAVGIDANEAKEKPVEKVVVNEGEDADPSTLNPITTEPSTAAPTKEPIPTTDPSILEAENASLRREVEMLRADQSNLEAENASLKREVMILRAEIDNLKKKQVLHEPQVESRNPSKKRKLRKLNEDIPEVMKRNTRSSKLVEDPATDEKKAAALKELKAQRTKKAATDDMPAVSVSEDKKADSPIPAQDAPLTNPNLTEKVDAQEQTEEGGEEKLNSMYARVRERKRAKKVDTNFVYVERKKPKVQESLPKAQESLPSFELLPPSQEGETPPQQPNPPVTDAQTNANNWVEFQFPDNSICNAMSVEDKERVLTYDKAVKGVIDYVTSGPGGDLFWSQLEAVWNSDMIDTGLIDYYCYLLKKLQEDIWENETPKFNEESRVGKSFFIPSHSWSCVYTYKNTSLLEAYTKNVKDAIKCGCRFIHFPMTVPGYIDPKSTTVPNPSHWVLFVYDTEKQVWLFYNSLRSTVTEDNYYKNGLAVVKHAEKTWKSSAMESNLPQDHRAKKISNLQYIKNSPQQGSGTLDCGIMIMYIMSCYVKGEPIIKVLPQSDLELIKVDILHQIINDRWSFNVQDFLDCQAASKLAEDSPTDCVALGDKVVEVEDKQDEMAQIVSSVVQSVNMEHVEPMDRKEQ